jgi:hypothetical protein
MLNRNIDITCLMVGDDPVTVGCVVYTLLRSWKVVTVLGKEVACFIKKVMVFPNMVCVVVTVDVSVIWSLLVLWGVCEGESPGDKKEYV